MLDRVVESEEDRLSPWRLGNKKAITISIGLSLILSMYILMGNGLVLPVVLPFVIGYFYSKGIGINGRHIRLKGRLGTKNFVVAFTWATNIVIFLFIWVDSALPLFILWLFFFSKSFINTVIYDFRDVRGDTSANIKTLPISLGSRNTQIVLLLTHIFAHLCIFMGCMSGLLYFEPILLILSWVIGISYISLYCTTKERSRSIVDGEWIVIMAVREILSPQLPGPFLGSI